MRKASPISIYAISVTTRERVMFGGLLIEQLENGPSVSLAELYEESLPEGDTLVRIEYSTLNYKDALAICSKAPIVRHFPMVPGIDFAGTVESTSNPSLKPGDRVVMNGFGLGESRWGGLAGKARVDGNWLLKLPKTLSTHDAMAIGTAGYTAMLCVMALQEQGVAPAEGNVLVTGASGGVGSFAIGLLAAEGYSVTASTGRLEEVAYLRKLGASTIVQRSTFSTPGKPLRAEQWAAAIDTLGSFTLANVCASTRYGGVVAACGMAQGLDFSGSVAPFILRGIKLIGIDSVYAPIERRRLAWARLGEVAPDLLRDNAIAKDAPLTDVIEIASALIEGKLRGRIVIKIDADS